ncbi:MAG: nucleotidyltransferase [Bacteroidales bacterium]|nr:nucleotidyltransferase [Bacteroidales bacterium]
MKPTLLVLAAGIGSRYGGIKQLDPVGPSGENIIDYSVYDAIQAGFGKVVFVIRKDIEEDFRKIYEPRLHGKIEQEYVLQQFEDIPDGFELNPDRKKPWGTAHAVLAARYKIHEPFAVINADDFYGREAFQVLAGFMNKPENQSKDKFAMVGFQVKNTLSDFGGVSRGICYSDEKGHLKDVVERYKIRREDGAIKYLDDEGKEGTLDENTLVSMNFWGFQPFFFEYAGKEFNDFMKENHDKPKAEFLIPTVINKMIEEGRITVKVLESTQQWFGVTYKEDKQQTEANIRRLIRQGVYPENLWK